MGVAQQLERHKVAEKRPVQSKFLVLLLNLLEEFAADELKPHGPSEVKFIRQALQRRLTLSQGNRVMQTSLYL